MLLLVSPQTWVFIIYNVLKPCHKNTPHVGGEENKEEAAKETNRQVW